MIVLMTQCHTQSPDFFAVEQNLQKCALCRIVHRIVCHRRSDIKLTLRSLCMQHFCVSIAKACACAEELGEERGKGAGTRLMKNDVRVCVPKHARVHKVRAACAHFMQCVVVRIWWDFIIIFFLFFLLSRCDSLCHLLPSSPSTYSNILQPRPFCHHQLFLCACAPVHAFASVRGA